MTTKGHRRFFATGSSDLGPWVPALWQSIQLDWVADASICQDKMRKTIIHESPDQQASRRSEMSTPHYSSPRSFN